MADEERLARLRASIAEQNDCAAWNQWRKDDQWQTKIDLYSADLTDANLRGADLTDTSFLNAYLTGAVLSSTTFFSADLRYAHLTDAHLRGADLRYAHLAFADLTDADLTDANLTLADLSGADLSRALMKRTILGNVDLRNVKGLETVQHHGPSTIGVDTLYRSMGMVPEVFLRGCGTPDSLIEFAHALVHAENPIDYYSAFISYNHQDEAFATRLYNDLQANNVRCWKYTEDMKIGDPIHTRVDEAIRFHDKLLVIFSEHALQSGWVAGEVETALAREKRDKRQVLFPVTIDTAIRDIHLGWAAEIWRTRNMGNFTGWEHQAQYQPQFDRLLRDLKADSR